MAAHTAPVRAWRLARPKPVQPNLSPKHTARTQETGAGPAGSRDCTIGLRGGPPLTPESPPREVGPEGTPPRALGKGGGLFTRGASKKTRNPGRNIWPPQRDSTRRSISL